MFRPLAISLVIVLTILYVGAYYALLLPPPFVTGAGTVYPQYRIGGRAAIVSIHPIHEARWRSDHAWYALKCRLRGKEPELPTYR